MAIEAVIALVALLFAGGLFLISLLTYIESRIDDKVEKDKKKQPSCFG